MIAEAARDVVEPSETPVGACRDKDDDNILACAVEAAAEYLVTGDKDLLHMKTYKGIRIVMPREFELLFDR